MEGPDWEARGRWQVSGALIGCDASETRKTPFCNMWYHMSCCGLDFVPAGDWICPNCGGPPFPPASARKYLPHPESASGSSGSDDDGEDEYEHGRRFEPYAPPLTEAEIKAGTTLEHDDGTHSASLYAHFAPPPDIVPEARATRASIARAQANRLHETMMQERTSARRGGAGGDVESSSDTDSEFENASDDGSDVSEDEARSRREAQVAGERTRRAARRAALQADPNGEREVLDAGGIENLPRIDTTRMPMRKARSILDARQRVGLDYVGAFGDKKCKHCRALLWPRETESQCCGHGKVELEPVKTTPAFLSKLFTGQDADSKLFRQCQRQLNNAVAVASLRATEATPPTGNPNWRPSLVIRGGVASSIGPLIAAQPRESCFAQVYTYDPNDEGDTPTELPNVRIPSACRTDDQKKKFKGWVTEVRDKLKSINPYIKDFVSIAELIRKSPDCFKNSRIVIDPRVRPNGEHERRYNLPEGFGLHEVSVLVKDNADHTRVRRQLEVVVRAKPGEEHYLKTIPENHRSYDPTRYALLFPNGQDGWHHELTKRGKRPASITSNTGVAEADDSTNDNPDAAAAGANNDSDDVVITHEVECSSCGSVCEVSDNDAVCGTCGDPLQVHGSDEAEDDNGDHDGDADDAAAGVGGGSASSSSSAPANPNTRRNLTVRDYYAYRLHPRWSGDNTLFYGGRLFQEYVCIAAVKMENTRLQWIRFNQDHLRASTYTIYVKWVNDNKDTPNVGNPFILPGTYTGGPRFMQGKYLDAMTICRKMGKPDLFITMTCNTNWPEITSALLPGQVAADRCDLVSRVFKLKKDALMKGLLKDGWCGRVCAHCYAIEFQKRGLPHAHILIIFRASDKVRTVDDVDDLISAEIPPDPDKMGLKKDSWEYEQASRLRTTVLTNMIHGPCVSSSGAPDLQQKCRLDDPQTCGVHFPREFRDESIYDATANRPVYRRRSPANGGETAEITKKGTTYTIDNGWVVPYSPFLMLKFDCHLNVEAVAGDMKVKYLFKYVHKGPDRASAADLPGDADGSDAPPAQPPDEIANYIDCRSLGSSEATWRLFAYAITARNPSVMALSFHLEGEEHITFDPAAPGGVDGGNNGAQPKAPPRTQLKAFFEVNAAAAARGEPNQIIYDKMPEFWSWVSKGKKWKKRARSSRTSVTQLGRLHSADISSGERFYLRLLLLHQKGPTSFADLRTVEGGSHHDTFKGACSALGLLADDNEWHVAMENVLETRPSVAGREILVAICSHNHPSEPGELYDAFKDRLADDFENIDTIGNDAFDDTKLNAAGEMRREALLMEDLEQRFHNNGRTMLEMISRALTETQLEWLAATKEHRDRQQHGGNADYNMSDDTDEGPGHARVKANYSLREEVSYNRPELSEFVERTEPGLNDGQRSAYEAIKSSVNNNGTGGCFFLQAAAGTGKTHVSNLLLALVRSRGQVALAVASSGIAATLLDGGTTAHRRFRFPLSKYVSDHSPLTFFVSFFLLSAPFFFRPLFPLAPPRPALLTPHPQRQPDFELLHRQQLRRRRGIEIREAHYLG